MSSIYYAPVREHSERYSLWDDPRWHMILLGTNDDGSNAPSRRDAARKRRVASLMRRYDRRHQRYLRRHRDEIFA